MQHPSGFVKAILMNLEINDPDAEALERGPL
jgi:hypothetical protein